MWFDRRGRPRCCPRRALASSMTLREELGAKVVAATTSDDSRNLQTFTNFHSRSVFDRRIHRDERLTRALSAGAHRRVTA